MKYSEIHIYIYIIIIITNTTKVCMTANHLQNLNRPQCPFTLKDCEIHIKKKKNQAYIYGNVIFHLNSSFIFISWY